MPILNVENIASTVDITTNGLHDVAQYTTANVDVEPAISPLNVTPTTSAQTITAPAGTDGYSPVNVSAVTSSIDANIQAGNIKDGVTILGVTGNYQGGGGTQVAGFVVTGTVVDGELQSPYTIKSVGITVIDSQVDFFVVGFQGTDYITSVDFSSLTTISGSIACNYMFDSNGGLTSVDLSSLTTISGSSACVGMFSYCSSLTNVDFSSLTTISGGDACQGMFNGCMSLETISFPALTSNSFGTRKNQFVDMFSGCDALTEIHFPSNVQSVIEGLDGYDTNFGAENATIYFDLAATE